MLSSIHFFAEGLKDYFKNEPNVLAHHLSTSHPEVASALIFMLGPDLVDIVNNMEDIKKKQLLEDPKVNRAYRYFSIAAQDFQCPAESSLRDFMTHLFAEKPNHGMVLMTHGDPLAAEIHQQCKDPKISDAELLSFLHEKLEIIDSQNKTGPDHHGKTTMQIMYCIEQLNKKKLEQPHQEVKRTASLH